jgi:3-phenylpropionate/cinnamic acid dioxygenase small subunit
VAGVARAGGAAAVTSGTAERIKSRAGERIPMRDPLHFEVVEFLEDEATMLDHNELMSWLQIMAEDVVYRMPVRATRLRDDEGGDFEDRMFHLDDSLATLSTKAMRLATTPSAWAENPPSRTRRFITNIRVYRTAEPDEYFVTSSILVVRSRYDRAELDLVSAERHDAVRRSDAGFKLAERYIFVDQSTIGTANLAIFL